MEHSRIHPIQGNILKTLVFKPQSRFSELNTGKVSNDHFTFHIKRLLELGLIEKTKGNLYQLTTTGKRFSNRLDVDSQNVVFENQAKLSVLIVPLRHTSDGLEYLTQQRLKQPYFGFHGFPTGKIKQGETIQETAQRELREETGLVGDFTLTGIRHKMDYERGKKLLEDKYFFVLRAENLRGNLRPEFGGGKNMWLSKKEIEKLPNLFHDVIETMEMIVTDEVEFTEREYTVQDF